jgi:hypothetical protein
VIVQFLKAFFYTWPKAVSLPGMLLAVVLFLSFTLFGIWHIDIRSNECSGLVPDLIALSTKSFKKNSNKLNMNRNAAKIKTTDIDLTRAIFIAQFVLYSFFTLLFAYSFFKTVPTLTNSFSRKPFIKYLTILCYFFFLLGGANLLLIVIGMFLFKVRKGGTTGTTPDMLLWITKIRYKRLDSTNKDQTIKKGNREIYVWKDRPKEGSATALMIFQTLIWPLTILGTLGFIILHYMQPNKESN